MVDYKFTNRFINESLIVKQYVVAEVVHASQELFKD